MAINERELRIGNIVSIFGNITIVTLKLFREIEEGDVLLSEIDSIPLTEKVLIDNCGFEKSGVYFVLRNLGVFDECDKLATKDFINFEFGYYGNKKMQYLHELQNFIYGLTGQELEVKFDTCYICGGNDCVIEQMPSGKKLTVVCKGKVSRETKKCCNCSMDATQTASGNDYCDMCI